MSKYKFFKVLSLSLLVIILPLAGVGANKLFYEGTVEEPQYMSPHAGLKPLLDENGSIKSATAATADAGFQLLETNVKCVNGSAQVLLSWSPFKTKSGYYIQRRTAGTIWRTVSKRLASIRTTYTDTNLPANTTYSYRIRALGVDGVSLSNVLSVRVGQCSAVTPTPIPTMTTTPSSGGSGGSTPTTTLTPTPSPTSAPTLTPTPQPTSAVTPTPTLTPTPAPTPTLSSSTAKSDLVWGAFNGWRVEDGPAFEAQVGKKMKTRAVFVHWGNENAFPLEVANPLKAQGASLTVFWEAMDYNGNITNQPRFSYNAIIRGDHDAYIKSFAEQIKAFGGPVILIPFSEMNGNWNPWAGTLNGNTPQLHIQAWRHIKGLFAGVNNVKFGWAVNNGSVPNIAGNQIEDYYPGDAYVDYVGVDGFNFANPWQTFTEVFDTPLKKLSGYNKPIYIFSTASAAGVDKAEWIRDAFRVQLPKYPKVVGLIWFNENKEKDWRVWSDPASLEAFKSALP